MLGICTGSGAGAFGFPTPGSSAPNLPAKSRSQALMPPRSKVITMLPPYIRQELNRRLFENGFRDYEGLAQWVRGQGYEISDDSLWRYGRASGTTTLLPT